MFLKLTAIDIQLQAQSPCVINTDSLCFVTESSADLNATRTLLQFNDGSNLTVVEMVSKIWGMLGIGVRKSDGN